MLEGRSSVMEFFDKGKQAESVHILKWFRPFAMLPVRTRGKRLGDGGVMEMGECQ